MKTTTINRCIATALCIAPLAAIARRLTLLRRGDTLGLMQMVRLKFLSPLATTRNDLTRLSAISDRVSI